MNKANMLCVIFIGRFTRESGKSKENFHLQSLTFSEGGGSVTFLVVSPFALAHFALISAFAGLGSYDSISSI